MGNLIKSLAVAMVLAGCGADDTGPEGVTECRLSTASGTYLAQMRLRSGSSGCPAEVESVVKIGGPLEPGCTRTIEHDPKECAQTSHVVCVKNGDTTDLLARIKELDNAGTMLSGVATVETSGPGIAACYGTYDVTYNKL